jgi:phenylacetate-CoA ligase
MSSYHLADQWIPYYLDALKRYRVRYLWGYSSSLHALAQGVLAAGRTDLKMAVVLSSAEPVLDYQRKSISRAFGTVCETYGMTEIAAAASECQHGTLHEWPDTGYVELFEEDSVVESSGDLVATGLINFDMPLIRYRVGDRLTRPVQAPPCPCGRTLPVFGTVEGRIDDVLFTVDGRKIGRMDPVFKSDLPIREAQIIQERLDRVRVRFVPTRAYREAAMQDVVKEIQARMGPIEVILEPVTDIPRQANAKFKAVINEISAEENR